MAGDVSMAQPHSPGASKHGQKVSELCAASLLTGSHVRRMLYAYWTNAKKEPGSSVHATFLLGGTLEDGVSCL
jgi:hypothetical protein